MMKSKDQSKPTLVFVYNADSGIFNALADAAHKTFSPQTYQCNLCALTYSTFGMRKGWKRFLETLDSPFRFLHADELRERHGISDATLPAIFKQEGESLKLWIDAASINACRTMDDLKSLIIKESQ
ncbi:MAG TPA: hypothetical protein VGC89_09055 [Pyrinomonadaceae bacterium]